MKNTQEAPYPTILEELIEDLSYKSGWRLTLRQGLDRGQGSVGLTLDILIHTPDSYNENKLIGVHHYFPVPPAAYDYRSWRRWLFEQILLVERHEAAEFFRFITHDVDAETRSRPFEIVDRPFAPSHGPGNDPYLIREVGTIEDQRTTFRGDRF